MKRKKPEGNISSDAASKRSKPTSASDAGSRKAGSAIEGGRSTRSSRLAIVPQFPSRPLLRAKPAFKKPPAPKRRRADVLPPQADSGSDGIDTDEGDEEETHEVFTQGARKSRSKDAAVSESEEEDEDEDDGTDEGDESEEDEDSEQAFACQTTVPRRAGNFERNACSQCGLAMKPSDQRYKTSPTCPKRYLNLVCIHLFFVFYTSIYY